VNSNLQLAGAPLAFAAATLALTNASIDLNSLSLSMAILAVLGCSYLLLFLARPIGHVKSNVFSITGLIADMLGNEEKDRTAELWELMAGQDHEWREDTCKLICDEVLTNDYFVLLIPWVGRWVLMRRVWNLVVEDGELEVLRAAAKAYPRDKDPARDMQVRLFSYESTLIHIFEHLLEQMYANKELDRKLEPCTLCKTRRIPRADLADRSQARPLTWYRLSCGHWICQNCYDDGEDSELDEMICRRTVGLNMTDEQASRAAVPPARSSKGKEKEASRRTEQPDAPSSSLAHASRSKPKPSVPRSAVRKARSQAGAVARASFFCF
jgi:hypothetical protein